MNLTRSIFAKLNEAADVKKPYGDKPEEGKKESIKKKKGKNIPKGKTNVKVKAIKLENKNKQEADAYANDTDRVMTKIEDKTHSDKGNVAKTTGKKSVKTIKYPFGDKVETPADNKLIKEGAGCENGECVGKGCEEKKEECDKPLKEDGTYSYGAGLLKEIYNQYVDLGMEDEFFDDCYNKMDISEDELQDWYNMGECDKPVKECDKTLKESSEYSDDEIAIADYYTDAFSDDFDGVFGLDDIYIDEDNLESICKLMKIDPKSIDADRIAEIIWNTDFADKLEEK